MQYAIKTAADLGKIMRATRKTQKLRQDDTAGASGVSESFLGKVESGNSSVTWGMMFQVLDDLGIQLSADITQAAAERIALQTESQT